MRRSRTELGRIAAFAECWARVVCDHRPDDDSEDYNVSATVTTPSGTVRRVLCRLWLPKRMSDPIRLVFYPTPKQADRYFRGPNPISFSGAIVGFGEDSVTIWASEAWVDSSRTRWFGRRRRENVFEADPIDLQVLHRMSRAPAKQARKKQKKVTVDYVLTPSVKELSPAAIVGYMPNGAVRVKTVREFSFTLTGGRRLKFVKRYRHEQRGEEDVAWYELVATEQRLATATEFGCVNEAHLDELDDFLTLVSFAARFRVVCIGIDAGAETGDRFTFYRKNRTVPERTDQDTNDAVIDLSDFEPFIRRAYRRFMASGNGAPEELVRHALQLVLPREDRTVESDFTTLYAALETLVLWHRRAVGMEFVIEDRDEWTELRRDLERFLKNHRLLSGNRAKRQMIYAKLEELRRVSFGAAFARFCGDYRVQVDDLWPVMGKRGDMSLSEIRNHIVHGSALKWSQFVGLIDARDHLRWTVERMLLAVFGWPLEKSKVRPDWLKRNRTAMVNLERSREAMRGMPELPPDTRSGD